MCHGHGGCDPVASLSFAGLAQANVHARVGGGFIGIIVVGQEILLELTFITIVALRSGREGQRERDNIQQTFIGHELVSLQ